MARAKKATKTKDNSVTNSSTELLMKIAKLTGAFTAKVYKEVERFEKKLLKGKK